MATIPRGSRSNKTRPSHLLHILEIIQDGEIADGHPFRPDEDSEFPLALVTPIPLPTQTAVIFPHGLIELDPDPFSGPAGNLLNIAYVHDLTSSGIIFAHATSLSYRDTLRSNLVVVDGELGIEEGGSIGVEATELFVSLPRQHAVGSFLVAFYGQRVFLDGGDIRVIFAEARGARIGHLEGSC